MIVLTRMVWLGCLLKDAFEECVNSLLVLVLVARDTVSQGLGSGLVFSGLTSRGSIVSLALDHVNSLLKIGFLRVGLYAAKHAIG
jgi:hypothetical protein